MNSGTTYRYAQDIDVLSVLGQGLGDGHDIRVVTLLQGCGNEHVDRFAGGGKVMVYMNGLNGLDHFASAGKMVWMNDSLR